MAGYAIIKLGGKQYVVREGEKLLVDRLAVDENKTFKPDVIFAGGDGKADIAPKGQPVTAKVLGHVQGEKIRIGKYRRRTGYRRHTGHRSKLTQIEIQSIGASSRTSTKKADTEKGSTAAKPKASAGGKK
jgi:large subunit ribosomal protein L21